MALAALKAELVKSLPLLDRINARENTHKIAESSNPDCTVVIQRSRCRSEPLKLRNIFPMSDNADVSIRYRYAFLQMLFTPRR
jgi:hypothetical protein